MEKESFMRRRFQKGCLKIVNGAYVASWRQDGHRPSRTLGRKGEISKAEALRRLAAILEPINNRSTAAGAVGEQMFGEFVEHVYFPFYERKWKSSTAMTNRDRVHYYLMSEFRSQKLDAFTRDELQTFLDHKATLGLSFSTVDHLRWDLKQIFGMAVSEGALQRNPAQLIFTPRDAARPPKRTPTGAELRKVFCALDLRERLIYMLAFMAGMRPGEIFGLKWAHIGPDCADIQQRLYRGKIDSPKTHRSVRKAAFADGLSDLVAQWKSASFRNDPDAWVFPSETLLTPLSKENCWRRCIKPRLQPVGLDWVNFQALRRAHSSLMRELGEDPKVVADQLGHGIGVNIDVYTSVPLARRKEAANRLESGLRVM
jgi:integrase